MGIHQGNKLKHNSSGNANPVISSYCALILGLQRGTGVQTLISTYFFEKAQAGNYSSKLPTTILTSEKKPLTQAASNEKNNNKKTPDITNKGLT